MSPAASTSRFVAGAALGAVTVASAEVAWIIAQPSIPLDVVRSLRLLPPRDLLGFAGAAIATYVPLSLGLAAGGALLLRPLLRRLQPPAALLLGVFLSATGLASGATMVWIAMLSPEVGLISGRLALHYALAALAIAAGCALPCRWLAGRVRSAGAASACVAWLPALLLAAAFVLQARIEYPEIPPRGTPRDGLPNLLFITLDTLRADHVGAYSNGAVKTPVLDRLAREGVRFENAISQVPTTTPSHVSMFTSVYPFAHGAKNGVPMRAELPTLPAELRRLGYHTAAFIAAYTTRSQVTGLGPAFDVYVDSLNPRFAFLSNDTVEQLAFYRVLDRMAGNQIDAPVVRRRVRGWLEDGPPEPFFAWVHFFDPHLPYHPPERFVRLYPPADDSALARELALYKASVSFTDDEVGALLDGFEARGLLDDAIVCVTSDHGEAFGEPHPHIDSGHGLHLYDSVLRVPLILWGPTRVPAGRVVEAQVQTLDVAPTLLDLVGAPVPAGFAGRVLTPLLDGDDADRPAYAFSQTAHFVRPRWFSVRSRDWKLIVNPDDGDEELFDLRADPAERANRAAARPEVAARYRARLRATMRLDQEGAGLDALDAETRERLRALGYLPDDS